MSNWQLGNIGFLVGIFAILLAGCGKDEGLIQVSGTVTVDGQIPAAGSSITFFPVNGNARSAGDLLENGNYSVPVPPGEARVEIRVPKPVAASPGLVKKGPGAEAASGAIMESLPAKYHDMSELKYTVTPGPNKKNWELSTQ